MIQRTLVDITPRKVLQQQMEREQEMYRVAMEASSDTMFEYQMDTDLYTSYKPQARHGVIRGELRNYSQLVKDEKFVHPEDAPAVMDNIFRGRANLAKSEFLSRMSHDIRAPMNAILGMEAIAEKNLNNMEKVSDCLSKIRISGDHLLGLINEVLDMSKIEFEMSA